MTPEIKQTLKDAFNVWAKSVENPDEPILSFPGTKFFSAKELAKEVTEETEVGQNMLAYLEHGVATEGLEKVVARLTGKPGGGR